VSKRLLKRRPVLKSKRLLLKRRPVLKMLAPRP